MGGLRGETRLSQHVLRRRPPGRLRGAGRVRAALCLSSVHGRGHGRPLRAHQLVHLCRRRRQRVSERIRRQVEQVQDLVRDGIHAPSI